jgi:ElaB/YqjD/DUF883 family membrane-anchored ribosome-binding protein
MAKTKARKSSRNRSSSSIRRDVRGVIADAEQLLHATAGELGDKAKEVRKELTRKIEAAKERFQNLEDVKEAAEEGLKEVRGRRSGGRPDSRCVAQSPLRHFHDCRAA